MASMQGPSQIFKSNGVKLFSLQYSSTNVLPFIAQRYIRDTDHVLRPKLLHVYDTRDKNSLWWYVSPSHIIHLKPVVRSRCKRRLKTAFKQALKEHGLDEFGRRLVCDSQGNIPSKAVSLKGTAKLALEQSVLDAPYESILSQARRAVQYLQNPPTSSRRRAKRR